MKKHIRAKVHRHIGYAMLVLVGASACLIVLRAEMETAYLLESARLMERNVVEPAP